MPDSSDSSSSSSSDTSSASSSSSSGASDQSGTPQVTYDSTADDVVAALSPLPFLDTTDVNYHFGDVDGPMLFQLDTADELIELVPTLSRRSAVLLAAKIKSWQSYQPPRGVKRERSRSPARRANKSNQPGHDQLRQVLNNLLDPEDKLNDPTLDEKVAKALADFKDSFGSVSGDMLPPREVIKELLKAKEAGKPRGTTGVVANAPYVPYLELKRFTPACMPSHPSSNNDNSPSSVMLRCGCMAVSYAVIDVWSLADGFNYLMNCITKVAGQDGWSVALKYDEAVRSRWASSSIFDDSFNLHQAARQIDLECLIMVRSSLREGNKQEGSRFCFAFSKGGPGACKRPNCNYTHRCSICRSYKHGAAQHKKPPTEAASKSTPTEPVRLTANRGKTDSQSNPKTNT